MINIEAQQRLAAEAAYSQMSAVGVQVKAERSTLREPRAVTVRRAPRGSPGERGRAPACRARGCRTRGCPASAARATSSPARSRRRPRETLHQYFYISRVLRMLISA